MDGGRIKIGRVSKVDYKHGYISVTYQDQDDTVTDMMPYMTFNQEYHLPQVGDYVTVCHLSNGIEAGVVLGTFWSDDVRPEYTGKDRYRKELSHTPGKAFIQHDPESGELLIRADHIKLQSEEGTVTLADLLTK